jgi:hypothetical protein
VNSGGFSDDVHVHHMDRDKLRDFMIRNQDRILFGTDIGRVNQDSKHFAERYHRCFLLLESDGIIKGDHDGDSIVWTS